MRKIITIIVFFLCLIVTSSSAETINLVENGDFSSGSDNWEIWTFVKGYANTDDGSLNWGVTQAGGTWAGATQYLNADVSTYDSLFLKYDIFIERQNYDSPSGGYPAKFRLWYEDVDNNPRSYAGGFYYRGTGDDMNQRIYLPQGNWYSQYYGDLYTSVDFLTIPHTPRVINKIDIYGEGDVFGGSADNIQLLASTSVPEPATMALFCIGGAAMAFIIKRRKE